jgi:arylsulfatase A-like enzyme
VAADPFIEGPERQFRSTLARTSWMSCLRQAGLRTVTVSPFGERHAAWHWYANFNEIYNTGQGGGERADEVGPVAVDWLRRNAAQDNWFLHVNLWDPHTPYRTPASYGEPFQHEALPGWYTEEVRQRHWAGAGPHSSREMRGYDAQPDTLHPRQPVGASSMGEARRMFDGYDTGVRYADDYVGRFLNELADQGVLDSTAIFLSSDHGECLGELNIYGDHQTSDEYTTHIPGILCWPGVTAGQAGRVDQGLHYAPDVAATIIDLAGGKVPANWDGASFAPALRAGTDSGRDYLVVSQGAWSCQRSVRFGHYMFIRSYHDGYHGFPDHMLFDLVADPHEQHNIALNRPELVGEALTLLDDWYGRMMRTASHGQDPMWTVMQEGGPLHTRGHLPAYLERLRTTGRGEWAARLAAAHPREV